MHSKEIDNNRVIRELDFGELLTITESFDNKIITRLFQISSKVDLYQNISTLKNAITELKRIHSFLRVNIITYEDKKCFAEAENQNSLDNVKFLTVERSDNPSPEAHMELYMLLIKNELFNNQINIEKDLLWRVLFIKEKNNENDGVFKYNLVVSMHHAITEGRCFIAFVLQLLNIFDLMYEKTYVEQEVIKPAPTGSEILKENEGSSKRERFFTAPEDKPSFLNRQEAIEEAKKYAAANNELVKGFVINNYETNEEFIKVSDLVESSSKFTSEYTFLTVDKETVTKLNKKCKQNKVKMSSCLSLIFNVALRRIFEKLSNNEEEKKRSFLITWSVSLRQFAKSGFGQRRDDSFGCLISAMFFKSDKIINSKENFDDQFWKYAFEEQQDLTQRIEEGELMAEWQMPENIDDIMKVPEDKIICDLFLTNLGIIPSTYNPNGLTKIEKAFTSGTMKEDRIVFNNLHTLNDEINWSILYNPYISKPSLIADYINECMQIIHSLAN